MDKHKIKVEKSARYFTLGTYGFQVKTVLFVCHGYAQSAENFLEKFRSLANETFFIVAPEGLNRFYTRTTSEKVVASWMTKEDREDEIKDYVAYLDKVYHDIMPKLTPRARVIVLGFSQGAATVSRWAAMGESRLDKLILWCGFFPPDLPVLEIHENVRVAVVTASEDAWISQEDGKTQVQEMKKIYPDLVHIHFEGEHKIDLPTLKEILKLN